MTAEIPDLTAYLAAVRDRIETTDPGAIGWYGTNVKDLLADLARLLRLVEAGQEVFKTYATHHGKDGGLVETYRALQDARARYQAVVEAGGTDG